MTEHAFELGLAEPRGCIFIKPSALVAFEIVFEKQYVR